MRKGSGAGINLIFFILALLLTGALAGVGVYTYLNERPEKKSKPAVFVTNDEPETEPTETETAPTETSTKATTSKPAETTTTTAKTTSSAPDRLEYHPYISTITEKAPDVKYELTSEDCGDLFHNYETEKWSLSSFADSAVASVGKDKDTSSYDTYINSPNVTDSKSDIGMTAKIKDGKKLEVESIGGECTELKVVSNNDKYADVSFKADTKKGTLEADLTDCSFVNGLYVIHGEYTDGGKSFPVNIYLYVNCESDDEKDMHFYLCSVSRTEAPVTAASKPEETSEPAASSTVTTSA